MYTRLVWNNIRRAARDYVVYVVTLTVCVMLFYAFLSISSDHYHPDVGVEYDFTLLSDGMKLSIGAVSLLLLFLIQYVNRYMLRTRQRDFAVLAVMGMEQRVIAWLFFAETFFVGMIAVAGGILGGAVVSQFITAMLMRIYERAYRFEWMLFPDTVGWTVLFFGCCFLVMGLCNVRTIRKTVIIEMMTANRRNEPELKKSRWMPAVTACYLLLAVWMLQTGIQKIYFYYDSRFPLPARLMFWANLLFPAVTLLWAAFCAVSKRRRNIFVLLWGLVPCVLCSTLGTASVAYVQREFYLSLGAGMMNQYLMFLVADVLFLICAVICLMSRAIVLWKEKAKAYTYSGCHLFFFGQLLSKLVTTTKTMSVICMTFVAAVFLFVSAPLLCQWSFGYLDSRSMYDVQISSDYHNVFDEKDLRQGSYEEVTEFFREQGITVEADETVSLYLPERERFHDREKLDFPAVAISLSDYNAMREMLGLNPVTLRETEFTTQWHLAAEDEEREEFLQNNRSVSTDAGELTACAASYYDDAMGENLYNRYTRFIYVFPDAVCEKLLPVNQNRYIMTKEPISYAQARALEQAFSAVYAEESEDGMEYVIRLRTLQVNSTKGSAFLMESMMIYGAVVLMVICLTILSLQQLLDMEKHRYRFGVLRKLGADEKTLGTLVLEQLGVWFGLPVALAILVSAVILPYFLQMVSAELAAYVGLGAVGAQLFWTVGIFLTLFLAYFISTGMLFQRAVAKR